MHAQKWGLFDLVICCTQEMKLICFTEEQMEIVTDQGKELFNVKTQTNRTHCAWKCLGEEVKQHIVFKS